jgi:ABC-type uncharacterized transport system permease subunit
MTPKKNQLEMAVVSVVFIVLALVGVVATFTSGLLGAGIDGIMLISICLVVVLAFTIELFMLALDAGWIKLPAKSSPAKSSTAKTAAPATASPAK